MKSSPEIDSSSALGDFLRSRRERLAPGDVGLPRTSRRRTPGLRREEVAALAGIGIDWYVRLEQGRCVSPSSSTVDALARALRLSNVEHAHLRALTHASGERARFVREVVPASLRRMVEGLASGPAYVTGRRWDVLLANRAANVFFQFDSLPGDDRNILVYLLTNPAAKRVFGAAWADHAKKIVAQFRTTHDLWASDPAFVALLSRLDAGCPEFAGWWKGHDVRGSLSGVKTLRHPKNGAVMRFEHASFQSNDNPSLKLVIYTQL